MSLLKFQPLLKQTIWGGNKIAPFKKIDNSPKGIGESWEVSGVRGNESIIANGKYAGKKLNELVKILKADLVGKDNYARFANDFPLLVKFIDAREQLSIQVHPNDEQAHKKGELRGKTEMWYVMKSEENASLRTGLTKSITPKEYKAMVENDTITEALTEYKVKEGDVFFLPAGRIHSIGKGCFLAEIQETSDITYRIYDFKRVDKFGHMRELHTEQAAECIDYTVYPDYKTHYIPKKNEGVEIVRCPYFTTSVYDLTDTMTLDYSDLDSFVILVGLNGNAVITDDIGEHVSFSAGESILIPATTKNLKIEGSIKFLETFV
ncbi:mannose-6-phosphate isomerase, class I [Prevotella amnii]|uniref:Phosphohexomutase n=1 Tax=Prevotella amnii TaxID=419005 RepID=A0A134BPW6_9BACT|nr:type I phosphomannose isomerase catalytic subunit [Prevotella amnii]KXB81986.1 mannose-6-phosphate isomerase, class I [Prevotella amnii]